jgi:outer membrane protein assembly factor BamB
MTITMPLRSLPIPGMFLIAILGGAIAPARARADCLCGTAADEFAAERAGLEREWLLQLPFDASTSRLERIDIGAGLLVAQTGDGNVHAVQTRTGRDGDPLPGTLLWTRPLPGPPGPWLPAAIGPDLVVVARGDHLHSLERATGQSRRDEDVHHLPSAGPAVSGNWIYLPDGAGRVLRLPVNPYRQPTIDGAASKSTDEARKTAAAAKKPAAKATRKKGSEKTADKKSTESLEPVAIAAGGPLEFQVQAFNEGVLWCTNDGTLVTIALGENGWERNEFFLERPPAGRPIIHDGSIFVATAEGDLVRLDSVDTPGGGLRLTWRVFLDALPDADLFISGDNLVVSLGEDGFAVYSTKTGERLGRTWRQGRIVAVTGGRIWIFDRVGRLSSIDLATGEPGQRFCLGGFTVPIVNHTDDRLILASPNGVIVSLKPRE